MPSFFTASLRWFIRRVPKPRTWKLDEMAKNAISAKRCSVNGR
jgi:hypothetical protein